jgi:hypothetical protein
MWSIFRRTALTSEIASIVTTSRAGRGLSARSPKSARRRAARVVAQMESRTCAPPARGPFYHVRFLFAITHFDTRPNLSTMLGFYTDFVVGKDDWDQISIHPHAETDYHWLYHKGRGRKIRYFVLDTRPLVRYLCKVTLIKSGDKFTPRLHFSIRDSEDEIREAEIPVTEETRTLKASIILDKCHENFWSLMSYLRATADIDTPSVSFSMKKGSRQQQEIADAFLKLDPEFIRAVLQNSASGILTSQDLNQAAARKEQLAEFERGLLYENNDESYWQEFFNTNKWIFGYGLNYVILDVNGNVYTGGRNLHGKGGTRPDFYGSTRGKAKFSVLVEIKTPDTPLLTGKAEIRSGVWSLSRELTDAVAQIQGNTDELNVSAARDRNNEQILRGKYTVTPKGILVVGSLGEFKDPQSTVDIPHKVWTFERFRRSLTNVEVITFDELHERAKFIVDQQPA